MLLMQDADAFRVGVDVISGVRKLLRYVTLLTVVSGLVTSTSSTGEATYLQYLNGIQLLQYLCR